MEVYLITKQDKKDITSIVTHLALSGEYRSCCRDLSLGIIKSPLDPHTHTVPIYLGDNIRVVESGKVLFHGMIWSKDKSGSGNTINLSCKDYGIYLLKNKATYKFKQMLPEDIVKKVCSDFGIQTGDIAKTGKPISRNFIGVTLYEIIKTCYTLANDKKYMCLFEADRLSVLEKGVTACPPLQSETNLLSFNVSESLESMINQVQIFNKEDKLIKTIENTEQVKKYGRLSESIKFQDTKEDYNLKAKQTLKGIEQKINVTNLGDISCMTGKSIVVKEPYTGLNGKFYIDSDEHTWQNGIYTNKLTLNFQNLMDESESGSET